MTGSRSSKRSEAASPSGGQYLAFHTAGEEFATAIGQVREIVVWKTYTSLPGAPGFVRGAVDLHGVAVPVVDLSIKFGLGESQPGPRTCLVVIETPTLYGPVALMADSVSRVLDLLPRDIQTQAGALRLDHLAGIADSGQGFVLLLDLDRILSPTEAEALRTASSTQRNPAEAGAGAESGGAELKGAAQAGPGGESGAAGHPSGKRRVERRSRRESDRPSQKKAKQGLS